MLAFGKFVVGDHIVDIDGGKMIEIDLCSEKERSIIQKRPAFQFDLFSARHRQGGRQEANGRRDQEEGLVQLRRRAARQHGDQDVGEYDVRSRLCIFAKKYARFLQIRLICHLFRSRKRCSQSPISRPP